MDKIYEYKGKRYCEVDISLRDDDYAGDLYDLYWELKQDGRACEDTTYHLPDNYQDIYTEAEELVENEFEDLVVGEATEEDVEENRKFRQRLRVERMMMEKSE